MPKSRVFDDAASQYLIHSGAIPVSDFPCTFACWCKSDDAAIEQALISLGDNAGDANYMRLTLGGSTTGDPVRAVYSRNGAVQAANSTAGYSVGTWHLATAVFVTGGSRSAYLDGANKGTTTASTEFPLGLDDLAIGVLWRLTEVQFMSGSIALPAIWNVALSDADVATLYNSGTAVIPSDVLPTGLVAEWLFEDNDLDNVGSFDLTPVNSPTFSTDMPPMDGGGPTGPPVGSLMLMGVGR